ncbi:MAG: CehA/McbA family metallohydrolase [Eubacteriales bacterium]
MKKQPAFEGNGKMLKGGLHCHTTLSDGRGTPEEVTRLHAGMGYDFLALTDHRLYNRTNYAPETGILIIPGMEFDATFDNDIGFRCFHTVCLGENDETNGFSAGERFESGKVKNQFDFQKYLDWIHSKNNITFYCHPEWSSTQTRHFDKLVGLFAIEIWNTGCALGHDMDFNAPCWDEMLGLGHKIFGVATDDGHAMSNHCKGWVMVNAEKNDKSILSALREGRFYSSCGPVIKDFYVDGTTAHIETEPCKTILFHSDRHPNKKVTAKPGELLTRAEIETKNNFTYIRASIIDESGNRAWTNPIFF